VRSPLLFRAPEFSRPRPALFQITNQPTNQTSNKTMNTRTLLASSLRALAGTVLAATALLLAAPLHATDVLGDDTITVIDNTGAPTSARITSGSVSYNIDDGVTLTFVNEGQYTGNGSFYNSTSSNTVLTIGPLAPGGTGRFVFDGGGLGVVGTGGLFYLGNNTQTINLTNGTIKNVWTSGTAGGVFWSTSTAAHTFNINNVTFSHNSITNTSGAADGGVFWGTTSGNSGNFTNVIFESNTASATGGAARGGVAYNNGGKLDFEGAWFNGNTAYSNSAGSATARGGAIYESGGNATLIVNGGTFSGNSAIATHANATSAASGGAIYQDRGTAVTITNILFNNNHADNDGGAYVSGFDSNGQLATTFTNVIFTSNSAARGGAWALAGASNATAASGVIFTGGTFMGNSAGNVGAVTDAAGLGGAMFIMGKAAAYMAPVAINDVAFLNNTAQGSSGLGGAIYIDGTAAATIAITSASPDLAYTGNIAYGSGPTADASKGGFAYIASTGILNLNAAATKTLTIGSSANTAADTIIGASGAAIAINSTLGNTGAIVLHGDSSANLATVTVNAGALLLGNANARLGGPITVNTGARVGGIGAFDTTPTLNAGSSLQVGVTGLAAGNLAIPTLFLDGNISLNYAIASDLATYSTLTIGNLTTSAADTTITISQLLAADTTIKLFDATALTGALDADLFNLKLGNTPITSATFSIVGGNQLWLTFGADSGDTGGGNNILSWLGATTGWADAGNWNLATTTTATTFAPGDIVIFDNTATGLTAHLADTATAAAIYVNGDKTFHITGAALATDSAAGTLSGDAANGRLVLGQTTTDGAAATPATFTGTLDLTGQDLTATNNFKGGVDIYSGNLLISSTAQLGATLPNLRFLGTPATHGALEIASNATVTFDSDNGATQHLSILTGNAGAFLVDDNATLTFSNNNSSASGAAITLAAGATLDLLTTSTGAGSGAYLFTSNSTNAAAALGGAVSLTGASTRLNATNATFSDNHSVQVGGAINLASGANFTGTHLAFTGNTVSGAATAQGGAIYANTTATLNLSDVAFTGNTVDAATSLGGALYLANTSNITIRGSIFTSNTASSSTATRDQGGGAIYMTALTGANNVIIQDTVFTGNYSSNSGGAIYANTASPNLTNVAFLNNTAAIAGGAILQYSGNSITTVNTGTFIGNAVTSINATANANAGGGAFFQDRSASSFTNVLFRQNTSASDGGAIYLSAANGNTAFTSTFTNFDFDGNLAGRGGAAAITYPSSRTNGATVLFTNGTFSGNKAGDFTTTNNTLAGSPGLGGAIYSDYQANNLTLVDTVFTDNTAKGTIGQGGAIYLGSNIASTITINLTATADDLTYAGNTAYGATDTALAANGGFAYLGAPTTLNLNIAAAKTLTIGDSAAPDADTIIGETGAHLNINTTAGGDPANTGALILHGDSSANAATVTIAAGTLLLANPAAALGGPITIAAGARAGGLGTLGAATTGPVTLAPAAAGLQSTLQVGYDTTPAQTLAIAGDLTLGAGSILDYTNLANQLTIGGNLQLNGLSTLNISATTSGSWNLIDFTTSNLADDLANMTTLFGVTYNTTTNLLAGTDYHLGLNTNNLYIIFADTVLANNILTWTGANGPAWNTTTTNWKTTDTPALAFTQGDIVNFDDTHAPAPAGAPTDITLATSATATSIYFSGTQSYTLAGAGNLVTDATSGTWTLAGAADGKLNLGGMATDAADPQATYAPAFTGTLDLTGLTGTNNFTAGIRLTTGALRVLNNAQLGATLNNFILNNAGAATPATLIVAENGNLIIDGAGHPELTNRLLLPASTSLLITLEQSASMTFTNNVNLSTGSITDTQGAAIFVNPGASLTLAAAPDSYYYFTSNTAYAQGGIFTGSGNTPAARASIAITNAVFSNNYNNGSDIVTVYQSDLTLTNVTFTSNTTTANSGAIGVRNTDATLTGTNLYFYNNYGATQAGALFLNSTATAAITSATFDTNRTGGNGGAINNQSSALVTLTNVSLLDNRATGNGGAIYTQSGTLNYNVNNAATTLVAGNYDNITTTGSRANGISNATSGTATINFNIAPGSTLNMLDPITSGSLTSTTNNRNTNLIVTLDGGGLWNLGGDNTYAVYNNGAADGGNANAGMMNFTITSGTLHLLRGGIDIYSDDGRRYTTTTGNLSLSAANTNAARRTNFTLNTPATLSIGGANTIAASGAITLAANSTLTFDLSAYATLGGTQTAGDPLGVNMLTLTAPTIDAGSGLTLNFGLDLLNADAGTYNLVYGNNGIFTTANGQTNLLFGASGLTGIDTSIYSYETGIDNNTLWLTISNLSNHVITWLGATDSWLAPTGNWTASALNTPAPATFIRGDIINLADTITAPAIPDPLTTTINVDTTTTATIAAMFVSGTASYTITGAGITATPAVGTFTGSPAATGKLTLGQLAPDDASAPLDAPYTGTLTLANTAPNNFTAGIDILSGALIGNAQTLGVGPAAGILDNATLTFNQADTATYASVISGTGTLNKIGSGTLTLTAANTLTGPATIDAGALILGNATATLASSNININSTALLGGIGAAGGAVTVNSGGALMAGLTHSDTTTTAPETLAIAGALTINTGATLLFDIYNTGTNDLINAASLAVVGTGTIDISNAYTGTYALINTTGAINLSGGALDITKNGDTLAGTRINALAQADTTLTKLLLEITVTNTINTWTGLSGNNWSTTVTSWTNPVDNIYYDHDAVAFDDTSAAATHAITIDAPVTTAGMTVQTSNTYTFTGAPIVTTTAATTLAAPTPATGALAITGNGLVILANDTGNDFSQGITITTGTLQGTVDTLHTTAGIITDNATLVFDQAADATYTGTLAGAGALVKQADGNLTLSGSTAHTGATTLAAGILTLANANQIAASTTVTLLATGTLATDANNQTLNHLNGAGAINGAATGTLTLANTTNSTTYSGIITGAPIIKTGAQTLTLTGSNADTALTIAAGAIQLGDGSNSAAGSVNGPITIAATATLALDHGNTNTTLANTLAGNGLIDKLATDTATLTLTANNSAFTGTTTINAGALVLAPASALGGQTNLSPDTTLAGSGTLDNLTTHGSATITIGALNSTAGGAPETLWLTGTLTLAGPTTLNYDLMASGTGDRINAAGGLVRTGTDTLAITTNNSLSGTYTLITAANLTPTATNNLLGAPNTARTTSHFIVDNNNLNLVIATNNIAGLIWDGTNGSTWKNATPNWKTDDGQFLDGDSVIFDDTRAGANLVAIDASGVLATGMTVTTTAAGAYTFTGGAITTNTTMNSTATGALVNGALTLTASNAGLVILNNSANTFANGIYILGGTLQGNDQTLGAPAGITNNATLVFSQSTAATYSTAITGTGALVKTATGALTLDNAANTYTGGLTVQQGALTLLNSGTATQGAIAIAGNANLLIGSASAYTISNTLTGSGLLSIALTAPTGAVNFTTAAGNAFTGTVALGASTFTLAADNTTALTRATLQLNTGNTTTIATGTQTIGALTLNGGLLSFSTTIPADRAAAGIINATAGSGALTLTTGTIQITPPPAPTPDTLATSLFQQASPAGALDNLIKATTVTGTAGNLKLIDQTGAPLSATATAAITQAGAAVATGTYGYALTNSATTLDLNYRLTALTIATSATLALAPAVGDPATISATISGAGNLAITNTTTTPLTLAASNNYTGATTITTGSVLAGAANALGNTNALTLATPDAALNLGANTQTVGTLTTAANSTLNLGTGALTVNNGGDIAGTLAGAGALNLLGGTTTVSSANPAATFTTTIAPNATATLRDTAALGAGTINLAAPTSVLNVTNATTGTLANPLTGSGALNLAGTGTTTIATANPNYTGATTITAPVTAANAAALGAGPIAVNGASATLTYTATGTIANNITGANGTLNLAATTGVTTLAGNNTITTINALPGSNITAATAASLNSTNLAINAANVTLTQNATTLGNVKMLGSSTLGFTKGPLGAAIYNTATFASLTSDNTGATLLFNTDIGNQLNDTFVITGSNTGAFTAVLNNTGTTRPAGSVNMTLITNPAGSTATYTGSGKLDLGGATSYNYAINNATGGGNVTLDITQGSSLTPPGAAIAAAAGAMPLTWFAELDTLEKRLGDLHLDSHRETAGFNTWARAYTQRINVNGDQTLNTAGVRRAPFNETLWGTEVGADYGARSAYGQSAYIGAYAGYGASDRNVANLATTGNITSSYAGLYATLSNENGLYVDMTGKYNRFKNSTGVGDYNNSALGLSMEVGKQIALGKNWRLTPNIQAALAQITAQTYTAYDSNAQPMSVTLASTTSRQLRLGARAAYKLVTKTGAQVNPYVKMSLARQWTDGGVITVAGDDNTYQPLLAGNRLEAGLGVNWQVMQVLQVYIDYEAAWARDYTKPYGFTLGVNYAW